MTGRSAGFRTVGLIGLLTFASVAAASSADQGYRTRSAPYHVVDADDARSPEWYFGEYPAPSATYYESRYARGCRIGWWQSSYFGHPRPQWATYCRR